MASAPTISRAGFILAGNYPELSADTGLETNLRLFEFGERLGFDVIGIRQRHLETGVSSALTFLAAASQRTRTVALETDVVPIGYETPFRLAEDFATVDALSGGRVSAGISTSAPHADLLAPLSRGDEEGLPDPYARLDRFLDALAGRDLADTPLDTPYGPQIPRIQPHIDDLRARVWLGGGSSRSVGFAAQRGLRLLMGNIGDAAAGATFEDAQFAHVRLYREALPEGTAPHVGVERVIIPTDSATTDQRAHYASYATQRDQRTHGPVELPGGRRALFQKDLHGTTDEIAERLLADPTFDGGTELRLALPYGFSETEYHQILSDTREYLLPALGWRSEEERDGDVARRDVPG